MARKSRRRKNPITAVDYWLVIGAIVAGGVAVWAYKQKQPPAGGV